MRALALGLFLALVMAAPAGADKIIRVDKKLAVIVPGGSPVKFRSAGAGEEPTVKFTGTFTLHGTWHIGAGANVEGWSSPWFEPNPDVVARLPYWRGYPAKPTEILFDNAGAFVKALLPPSQLARLHRGKERSYHGRATIEVDGFFTYMSCGNPYYYAHFRRVITPRSLLARRKTADDNAC